MAKKKKGTSKKKTSQEQDKDGNPETFSISYFIEKYKLKPLHAFGFINYYGLNEEFRKEFEENEIVNEYTEEEFNSMYESYLKRRI